MDIRAATAQVRHMQSSTVHVMERTSYTFSSTVLHQGCRSMEKQLKQIKIQDQNLQQGIEVEKQRLLKGSKISQFDGTHTHTNKHVASNRVPLYDRQAQVNRDRFIHSSSISKTSISEQKLIATIRSLENVIDCLRHNQIGYKREFQALHTQITHLKSIITEKETLISRHTKEIQVIRERVDCQLCVSLRMQIKNLQEQHRLHIERIRSEFSQKTVTVVDERRIKQLEQLIIEKDTTINKYEHQLHTLTNMKGNRGTENQLKQTIVGLQFEITKLSQSLQKKDKDRSEFEERIRQITHKYETVTRSNKAREQENGRLSKNITQMKTTIQKLQGQLSQARSHTHNEQTSQMRKLQEENIRLRSELDRLTKQMERLKRETEETAQFFKSKEIQDQSKDRRIEQLTLIISEKQTEAFTLRQQIVKFTQEKSQQATITRNDRRNQQKIRQFSHLNSDLTIEVQKYQSWYEEFKSKYQEVRREIEGYKSKIVNIDFKQDQIAQLKRQLATATFETQQLRTKFQGGHKELTQKNKEFLTEITSHKSRYEQLLTENSQIKSYLETNKYKIEQYEHREHKIHTLQIKIKQLYEQISHQKNDTTNRNQEDFQVRWIQSQHKVKVLEDEIERLNFVLKQRQQQSIPPREDQTLKIFEYQQKISSYKTQIERFQFIERKLIQAEKHIHFLQENHTENQRSKIQIANYQSRLLTLEIQIERLRIFQMRVVQLELTIKKLEISPRKEDKGLTIELTERNKQINLLRIQIERLKIFEGKATELESQIRQLHNRIKELQSRVKELQIRIKQAESRPNSDEIVQKLHNQILTMQRQIQRITVFQDKYFQAELRIKSFEQQGREHQNNTIQILNLQRQIQRLRLFQVSFREAEIRIRYLQEHPPTNGDQERRHSELQYQITRLQREVDRLKVFEGRWHEAQEHIKHLEINGSKPVQNDFEVKLVEAHNRIVIMQREIDRLLIIERRIVEIQKYQKIQQQWLLVEKFLFSLLETYRRADGRYDFSGFENAPGILMELARIFSSLHQQVLHTNQVIQSLEQQIMELKRINRQIQSTEHIGGDLTFEIESLQQKIISLRASNETYMRINNALSAKLEASEMEREYIFNEYMSSRGELQRIEKETLVNWQVHSHNVSVDPELLRSRIDNIETVAASSMERMKAYYEQIQKDVGFQLSDMRKTVDILQENQQPITFDTLTKYKKTVVHLQMEVAQLQSAYRSFHTNVGSNIQSSNQEINSIVTLIQQKLEEVTQGYRVNENVVEEKSRLQRYLQQAQSHIQTLQNEKAMLGQKVGQLKNQFQIMKREANSVTINLNEANGKSERLKLEKEDLQVKIRQIQYSRSQLQHQMNEKVQRSRLEIELKNELEETSERLQAATNYINNLEQEKTHLGQNIQKLSQERQEFVDKQRQLTDLNWRFQQMVIERNNLLQNLTLLEEKIKTLQTQKTISEQKNVELITRCQHLQQQITVVSNRIIIKQESEKTDQTLEQTRNQLSKIYQKLVEAESYIFRVEDQRNQLAQNHNRLVQENHRLFDAQQRLEELKQHYQTALQENQIVARDLENLNTAIRQIKKQKALLENQSNELRHRYAQLEQQFTHKANALSDEKKSLRVQIQTKSQELEQVKDRIGVIEIQKEHLSHQIQQLRWEIQRTHQADHQIKQISSQRDILDSEKQAIQGEVLDLRVQVQIVQQQNNRLQHENNTLHVRYEQLQTNLRGLETHQANQPFDRDLEEVSKRLKEAQEYIAVLEGQNNDLRVDLTQSMTDKQRFIGFQSTIKLNVSEHQELITRTRELEISEENLQTTLFKVNNEKQLLQKLNAQLKERCKQLEEMLSQKDEHQIMTKKLIEAEQYILIIENDKHAMLADIEKLAEENHHLIENITKMERSNQQYHSQFNISSENQINTLKETINKLEHQNSHVSLLSNRFHLQVEDLQKRYRDQSQQIQRLNEERGILNSQNIDLRMKCEKLEQDFESRSQSTNMDRDVGLLSIQLEQYRAEHEKLTSKLLQANQQIEKIEKENYTIVELNRNMVSQNQYLFITQKNLNQRIQELQTENSHIQHEKYTIEVRLLETENKIELLQEKDQNSLVDNVRVDYETLLNQKNNEIINLRADLNERSLKLNEQMYQKEGLQNELINANNEVVSLQRKVHQSQEHNHSLQDAMQKFSEQKTRLSNQNQNIRNQIEQFRKNNANLAKKLQQYMSFEASNEKEQEISNLKDKNFELDRQNQRMREAISNLQLTNLEISQKSDTFKKSSAQIHENSEESIKAYKQEIQIHKEEIARQNEYIIKTESENRHLIETNQNCFRQIEHLKMNTQQSESERFSQLKAATDELSSKLKVEQILNESLYDFMNRFNNYLNSIENDIQQNAHQEYVFPQFPILQNLCQNVLYRLRLVFAQELEKDIQNKELSNHLAEKEHQIVALHGEREVMVQKIKDLQSRKVEADMIEQRYEEVLAQLVEREAQNKANQYQISSLYEEIKIHKIQLQDFSRKISDQSGGKSSIYQEKKDMELFLYDCLAQIDRLEKNSQRVDQDINSLHTNFKNHMLPLVSSRGQTSEISKASSRLKQIEQRLVRNDQELRAEEEGEDEKTIKYIKQIIDGKNNYIPEKSKLELYLDLLEKNIIRSKNISEKSSSSFAQSPNRMAQTSPEVAVQQHRRRVSKSGDISSDGKDEIQQELKELSEHMAIYHQEWTRRRQVCLEMNNALLNETFTAQNQLYHINQQFPQVKFRQPDFQERLIRIITILKEMSNQLQPEEDNYRHRSQFINTRDDRVFSSDFMQILDIGDRRDKVPTDQQFQLALNNLRNTIDDKIPNQSLSTCGVQTESDPRPLIDFLLTSNNIGVSDLIALKQKVAAMRAKEWREGVEVIKSNISRITQVLEQENSEILNPNNLDQVLDILVSNHSPVKLQKMFMNASNREIVFAINEAFETSQKDTSGQYRLQSSGFVINQIEERKRKFYQIPTRVSEDVHALILRLLSVRTDEEFLDLIEYLFQTIYITQQRFETIIRKKDEQYKDHTTKMNYIFNRNQSQQQEDFESILQEAQEMRRSAQTEVRFSYGSAQVKRSENMPK